VRAAGGRAGKRSEDAARYPLHAPAVSCVFPFCCGLINMNIERLRLPDLREPGNADKESYIRAIYRVALQRDPDPNALTRFLARDDINKFFPEILSSAEFRKLARSPAYAATRSLASPDRPRVLLFGAYGNGNLGDAIQASSLAQAINLLRPEIEVWA